MRLIVATRSSGPSASGKIIKEMPGSVASATPYIISFLLCIAANLRDQHYFKVRIYNWNIFVEYVML